MGVQSYVMSLENLIKKATCVENCLLSLNALTHTKITLISHDFLTTFDYVRKGNFVVSLTNSNSTKSKLRQQGVSTPITN